MQPAQDAAQPHDLQVRSNPPKDLHDHTSLRLVRPLPVGLLEVKTRQQAWTQT